MNIFKKISSMLWLSATYLKLMPQLIIGAWKIGELSHPVVSIFGGHNLKKGSKYLKWAEEFTHRLVTCEISILTGGGSGIMQAATCGAYVKHERHIHAMGVGVKGLSDEKAKFRPDCVQKLIVTDYFPLRKFLLIQYSSAYVIFPGAFGTLNELTEVITLMHTNKIPIAPIILIGKEFWQPLIEWVTILTEQGIMKGEHPEWITVTDDIDEVVSMLVGHCKKNLK